MFKLNFKENLKNIVNKKVSDVIDEATEPYPELEKASISNSIYTVSGPLYTDTYKELIDLINSKSKEQIVKKQAADNLFSSKSVITVFAFLLTSVLVQLDSALLDKSISLNEGLGIAVSLVGSISTIAARGSEGATGVYTSNSLPGLNKEDYDLDGVINKEDETPFG